MTIAISMAIFLAGTELSLPEATPELPFYENFEPVHGNGNWWDYAVEWQACDAPANRKTTCPVDPSLPPNYPNPRPNDSQTWGPYKFESWPDKDNGGIVFSGQRSGRQPIWDPMWASIFHVFNPQSANQHLRAKTQLFDPADILCDCDPWGPPSRPNFDVHGWLILTNPYRTDYFVLAINTKISWDHYVWATKVDGWHTTTITRKRGWHRFEIIVHPYTGHTGDVEFILDGVVVGQGQRIPGLGSGEEVNWLRLGGDPALLTEGYLTNTFEEIWYDEVALTACSGNPRLDGDADGDIDQVDFGLFQQCFTGPGNPFTTNPGFDASNCQCMDVDGDRDVDVEDLQIFVNCISGPAIPSQIGCDNLPPAR